MTDGWRPTARWAMGRPSVWFFPGARPGRGVTKSLHGSRSRVTADALFPIHECSHAFLPQSGVALRMSPVMRTVICLAGTVAAAATAAAAQAPTIQVQGRIQVQYRASSGDSSGNYNPTLMSNGFEVRRLRIQTNVRFGDNMNLVIQPSFEMGALRMRDAFLRVGLTPRFGVSVGQEKSPFQRYELTSSNNLLSIERGVRILRLSGKEGLNDLLANNGYASHDLGAFVDYVGPDNKVTVKVGVQNGSRETSPDVNNAKSFFGRATAIAITNADNQPVLQVGASFGSRDRAICSTCAGAIAYYADSSKQTTAFGLDAEWGGFRPGLHLIADFATGDNGPIANRIATGRNTGNLRTSADTAVRPALHLMADLARGDNVPIANRIAPGRNTGNLRTSADTALRTFRGFSLVGAYRLMTSGPDTRVIKMLEPALRIDYVDPDTKTANDQGILITPVLNIYFANTVLLRAGVDLYSYKDAAGVSRSAKEIKFSWQANF